MYKRVLLKLSGEAISSEEATFDTKVLADICEELKQILANGTQVAIVVGGGNIMRGRFASEMGMPRVEADKMGMLGTVINALAIAGALEHAGLKGYVQSAVEMNRVADLVDHHKALEHLEKGEVVIYGGGINNPYFSTDTATALRALEIGCDAILMAKNGCDGVYDKDPRKYADAVKYDEITYSEIVAKNLGVVDGTCAALLMNSTIESVVFSMDDLHNISRAINQEKIGTIIRK